MDEYQRKGVLELLMQLHLNDLNSLVTTSTQQLIKRPHKDKQDAINMIILHSPDAETILKRKLITRDLLFEYLSQNKVALYPPVTKDYLVQTTLEFWNSQNPTPVVSIVTNQQQETRICGDNNHTQLPKSNFNEMAGKFAEWFYKMFNEDQPINVEHFWQDCKLKLNLVSGVNVATEEVNHNVEEVVRVLFNTKSTHRMYLNPNLLPEGVQGRVDMHGLVMVLVCGTIHVDNQCVGVFEEIFGLARDPSVDNNWKIKYTELNLKSTTVIQSAPRLTDSALTSNFLALPEQ